jgi:hypothetical protein
MDWLTMAQNVSTFGVGTGILAFLVRSLVVNFLNRDLEAYRSKLNEGLEAHKSALTKDVEAFKSTLELVSIEHQIRFSKLHDKRAQVIQDLYVKLVRLDTAMHSVLKMFQTEGEPNIDEKIALYFKLHNELIEFFLPNRIFFGKDTCRVINDLLLLSREAYLDITTYPVDTSSPEYKYGPRELMKERHDFWKKARKLFETDISNLKEQIEAQFREMLGVKE